MRAEQLSADERKEQIVARFNQTAATYDSSRAIQACARRLLELANLQPGERVLDVAAGTGLLALPAARAVGPSGRVVGIDLTEGMVAQARRKAEEAGLANIDFQVGDAEQLDVEGASFGVVLCGLAAMFFPDPTRAAREWHRVLHPGGRVVFSVWRQQFGGNLRALLDARFAASGIAGPRLSSPDAQDPEFCQRLLEEAGFVDAEVRTEPHGFFFDSAEEYWLHDVVNSITGTVLARLPADEQARLKEEHLAEVAALATPQGIWRDATANFATGRKPAGTRIGAA